MHIWMIWRPTPGRLQSFHLATEFWSLLGTIHHVDSGHEPFNRAASRNKAVREAERLGVDRLVITDADCIPESQAVRAAWADPTPTVHLPYTSCTVYSTAGQPLGTFDFTCGGTYITTPETWWAAGGQDERFNVWAPEDMAFKLAHDTLVGPMTRHPGTLMSLGHERDPHRHTDAETDPHVILYRAYEAANGDPDRMRALCFPS